MRTVMMMMYSCVFKHTNDTDYITLLSRIDHIFLPQEQLWHQGCILHLLDPPLIGTLLVQLGITFSETLTYATIVFDLFDVILLLKCASVKYSHGKHLHNGLRASTRACMLCQAFVARDCCSLGRPITKFT